uniref:Uncharacterized protein n=1 Tax=Triticum urartu TaxID=4572 RepID=A0A8R7V4M4_TRIUA
MTTTRQVHLHACTSTDGPVHLRTCTTTVAQRTMGHKYHERLPSRERLLPLRPVYHYFLRRT